jgi:YD repeat-containing protein
MKKYTSLLLVVLPVFLLTSCQKESSFSNDATPGVSLKIKTYTEDFKSPTLGDYIQTFDLSYDAGNRVTAMTDIANPGNKFVFTYPSASMYSMELLNDNVFELHVDYYLNSQSLIDSSFQYNNTQDSSTEKYVYNAARQLTRLYEYDYSKLTGGVLWNMTDYKYDGNGNLIEARDMDNWVTNFTYDNDKKYVLPEVMPFQGSKSKMSLLTQAVLNIPGATPVVATYSYTFDNKDRISTVKEEGSNIYSIVKTYTYFD